MWFLDSGWFMLFFFVVMICCAIASLVILFIWLLNLGKDSRNSKYHASFFVLLMLATIVCFVISYAGSRFYENAKENTSQT